MALREVTSITFKRIHIRATGAGKAGHWWFEIGDPKDPDSESYGWYPLSLDSWEDIFAGVEGCLNDGANTNPARDAHHGEDGDESFAPLVKENDPRSEKQIADCLRYFAMNYDGKWKWLLGFGQNCHSFQRAALKHCELIVPPSVQKTKL